MPEKLDPKLLDEAVAAYDRLIRSALDSGSRSRFRTVSRLSVLAEQLLTLQKPRAGDFDADGGDGINIMQEGVQEGGMIMGQRPRLAIGGGDQMELTRLVIDAITGMQNHGAANDRARAEELESLLTVRKTLHEAGESADDIDRRIAHLRKEIANVVPADVLRGHPPGALGGANQALLGEPDREGEDGAFGPQDQGGQEELG